MEILGIDVGGSGIKGAPVDITTGEFTQERHKILTPQPATPDAVTNTIAEIVKHFNWEGKPLGCTFPAVIKHGVAYTAANVDDSWIGINGEALVKEKTGCPTLFINDADAAGIAEMKLGAGKDHEGIVILHTLGTGIGSAIFVEGTLVPNTEFGRLLIPAPESDDNVLSLKAYVGERWASSQIRKDEDLSWAKWAKRLNIYLKQMESHFFPDLFIIGGGVSRKHEKFFQFLELETEIVPAHFRNQAGIIGAALAIADTLE